VKQRDWFFYLVQTEYGDLFKVWLDYDRDEVKSVNIKYFDTVPVATAMTVLKTGFLFVGSEAGNQYSFSSTTLFISLSALIFLCAIVSSTNSKALVMMTKM